MTDGAIVLAGGQSRRMGRDKALIRLGKETLLERAVSAARQAADRVVIVTDRSGRYRLPGVESCEDLLPDAGPVAGIAAGLAHLGPGAHIVLACDMPGLQPELLRLLRSLHRAGLDAVVPWIDERPEPLCALYDHSALSKLQAFLSGGGRAAHRALEQLRVRRAVESELRQADPGLLSFANWNTPADLPPMEGA